MTQSPISQIRDLTPLKPLTVADHLVLAERHATRLLQILDITAPPVADSAIADLPRIEIRHYKPWPTSGLTEWKQGRWVIVLNATEPRVRQRFTLAHELKHIIDHRFARLTFADIPAAERHRVAEATCDHFAACLLMPRHWIKPLWAEGRHQPHHLARRFEVSEAAMNLRLAHLGLRTNQRRHAYHPLLPTTTTQRIRRRRRPTEGTSP